MPAERDQQHDQWRRHHEGTESRSLHARHVCRHLVRHMLQPASADLPHAALHSKTKDGVKFPARVHKKCNLFSAFSFSSLLLSLSDSLSLSLSLLSLSLSLSLSFSHRHTCRTESSSIFPKNTTSAFTRLRSNLHLCSTFSHSQTPPLVSILVF